MSGNTIIFTSFGDFKAPHDFPKLKRKKNGEADLRSRLGPLEPIYVKRVEQWAAKNWIDGKEPETYAPSFKETMKDFLK